MRNLAAPMIFIGLLIVSCHSSEKKYDLVANREIVKKLHQIWSNGKVEQLKALIAPDFVCHYLAGYEWRGIDGTGREITDQRHAFPDWNEQIVDMIAENDKVVTRYRSTGTHRGKSNGIDSTGNRVAIFETSIYRIADGKIAEQWCFADKISLLQQIQPKVSQQKDTITHDIKELPPVKRKAK